MIYLPTILILTLAASLIVAFIFNPVFAVSFMKPEGKEYEKPKSAVFKNKWFIIFAIMGVLLHVSGMPGFANFLLLMAILMVFNSYVLNDVIHAFQKKALPGLMNRYEKLLRWILKGKRPVWAFVSLFGIFALSAGLLMMSVKSGRTKSTFFPSGDPNFIYVYLKLPAGTDVKHTDSVTHVLEKRVQKILEKEKPGTEGGIVESIITNVAVSANNPRDNNRSVQPNLGRIQVSFVEYAKRNGKRTRPFMDEIRSQMKGIPGANIEVAQEDAGPPTDPPVNIEVVGDNFESIAAVATQLFNYLDTNRIAGIENLQADVDLNNPEITVNVDREKAMKEGLSTGQIGMEIRTAVFGKEISKLKEGEDEYKIQLRYTDLLRNNITDLMNMRITFMDMNTMRVKSIPVSAVAKVDYTNTTGGVKRKNVKRTIQLQSNVLDPTMVAGVNAELQLKINDFKQKEKIPADVTIKLSGQSEQEKETQAFLGTAFVIAIGLIFLILVLQFNSMSKPFIVVTEIFFSVIGVLIGYAVTGMTIATIMLLVGIVGLAGIVIKNGILLIEFTDELKGRGMRTREAAIQAGKIRIIPVLLTAVATILGLLPLAIGFNIDFAGLFSHLNPHIFLGGDSVVFWGPLSWTIIFGLMFSFFLTLVMVPSMYLIAERLRRPMERFYGTRWVALLGFLGPFFFITVGIMYLVRAIQGKKVWLGKLKPAPAKA
jgi:multidrug efflux pump subunit AcrB